MANKKEIVNEIVIKWNSIVTRFENDTITLCKIILEKLKDYPEETIKEIVKEVMNHPDMKRTVSLDRIYHGLRLIDKRPELLEAHNKLMEGKSLPDEIEKAVILKKDGTIFWEAYFKLDKSNLGPGVQVMLEKEIKEEGLSTRDIDTKIAEAKQEIKMEPEERKQEKYQLIKEITSMLRELEIHQLRGVKTFIIELKKGEFK